MLAPDLDTLRLTLHVLAATIWVGGQLTLAALVPTLRRHDREVPRLAGQAFARVAWPAFGVLVVTGIWNVVAVDDVTGAYRTTLLVKLAVVALSGVTALAHQHASRPRDLALYGALTGLTALLALALGVLLAG
jgi:putative copper export protein